MKIKNLWALVPLLMLALVFSGEASASHFRGGFIFWEKVSGNTVKFRVQHAWRASAPDRINLLFGDGGQTGSVQGSQIALLTDLSGNQYRIFEYQVTHTYPTNGNFTVSFSSCCRIGNLANGANGNFRVRTTVNLAAGQNGSSVMSLPYVLEVGNTANNIALNPIDADGPVSCRWATSSESGIAPPPATMTSDCRLVFNGTGMTHGKIFAGQVIMMQGGATTAYDMMFQVNANIVNLRPVCTLNGLANNTIPMGQPFSISVTGTDPEGLALTVNHLGLPSGATLTPAAGASGTSPMTATFNWTPAAVGLNAVTILFGDNINQSCQSSFSLNVINPFPVADAGGDASINEGAGHTLDGSASYDGNGDVLNYSWTQLTGTPVAINNPTTVTPSFTAPWLNSNETMTFMLTVNDGTYNDTDTVDVTVIANNYPPVTDAGDNGTIKEGATKTLDGSNSYDPNNEPIQSYTWTQVGGPSVTLLGANTAIASFSPPLGMASQSLVFQLQASDGKEPSVLSSLPDPNVSGDDLVTVQVVENSIPIANAGSDQTKDENNTVELDGTASIDPDGDLISYAWLQTAGTSVALSSDTVAKPTFTAPWISPGGEDLAFSLVVTDNDSVNPKSSISDQVVIHVTNANDPPRCDLAQPSVASLWPPSHTMQSVGIVGVSDASGDNVTITVSGVTQDEPVNGTGDGDTSPDASISGDNVLLRAERAGMGDGRVYNVSFSATDGKETCTGAVKVTVPHNRKAVAVDSGQSVDATQP